MAAESGESARPAVDPPQSAGRATQDPRAAADRAAAAETDQTSPLVGVRDRFVLPAAVCYLDGNSLGALPRGVSSRLVETVDQEWGHGLIRSWNDAGWVTLPQRVAARLASLLGARWDEIVVADSTSVNLFKALVAARQLRPGRRVLLTEDTNFPTDRYIIDGVGELLGDVEVRSVRPPDIPHHLDDDVAVLALTHVDYRTGARYDAAAVTGAAHDAGAVTVWDLSHSAGAVAVDLDAWQADFAVGCTYKYLNGGPGAPAYLYAARRHHDAASPIRGWFGHAEPFRFGPDYQPAEGAARFAAGTPAVLGLAALDTAMAVWDDVDPVAVEAVAAALTTRFIDLVDRYLGAEVEVVTPRDPARRGAQVSLAHPEAYAVMQALISRGVIGDHRPPDLLRFGFAPLYVRHVDVHDAVMTLRDVLATAAWDRPDFRRPRTVI